MTLRLPKRPLQPEDLKNADRVLETLNPLQEVVHSALAGGISLDNLKKVVVTMYVTAPDEWVPLSLANGFVRHPALTFPVPSSLLYADAGRVRVRLRGLLTRGAAPALGTVIASIPKPAWQARHDVDGTGAHAFLETQPAGTLTFGTGNPNALSLERVDYETSEALPAWSQTSEATLVGDAGMDYGVPLLVLSLSAERKDRKPVRPDPFPLWETPLVGEGRKRERKLRIRRLGGLQPGVQHTCTFLCLYP